MQRHHTPTQTPRPTPRFEICARETALELAFDIAAELLDSRPNLAVMPTFDQLPTRTRKGSNPVCPTGYSLPWEDLAEYTAETVAERYYRVVTPEAFDNLVSLAIDQYNKHYAGTNPNNYA